MENSKEALEVGMAVYVNPPLCGEKDEDGKIQGKCKGGEINLIRKDGTVIVHCKGSVCVVSEKNVKQMGEENQGGSPG